MTNINNRKMSEMTLNYLISTSLRGISQVVLTDNVVSGLIFLIAITVSDYRLGIVALASAIIGTLIGYIGGADRTIVDKGLFGFNSVLIGLAVFIFFTGTVRWGIALVGAAFVAIFTAAMMEFLKNLQIPVLTSPYVIMTWILLLASYNLKIFHLTPQLVPQYLAHWSISSGGTLNIIDGLIDGIGQVFFESYRLSAILIIVGIFWADRKLGIYAVLGTVIGWLTAYSLQPSYALINLGLYGYNAVLTMIAVAGTFDADSPFALIRGIIATIIVVPITASINTLLLPYGIPPLTMPFVLVTWIFIGARRVLPKL